MNDQSMASAMPATMMRALSVEGCRAYVAAMEMRRNLLKAHLKAVDDELRSAKMLLQRMASPEDSEALQHAFAQLFSDRLEHQATLSREYARVFADRWSTWLEECQTFTSRWLAVSEQSGRAPDTNGLGGLAGAFGSFYEQLERMSALMTPTSPIPPSAGKPNGSSRARTAA